MEVILLQVSFLWVILSILHVCGGDPDCQSQYQTIQEYSPRMWRWSWTIGFVNMLILVFSTYVEVILPNSPSPASTACILHVCGGDPKLKTNRDFNVVYSPRMWRWSLLSLNWLSSYSVFSTYVEVIPTLPPELVLVVSILHVCGGDPSIPTSWPSKSGYSPRMWRWSSASAVLSALVSVFSTYVEVIPYTSEDQRRTACILHVCGGDPHRKVVSVRIDKYSPRMWRWS